MLIKIIYFFKLIGLSDKIGRRNVFHIFTIMNMIFCINHIFISLDLSVQRGATSKEKGLATFADILTEFLVDQFYIWN